MAWLNPIDPKVRAAVVSGYWGRTPHSEHHAPVPTDPDEIDVIADCLEQASDILSGLTADTIHPALQVVEDYVCYPGTARLSPTYLPLRKVVAMHTVLDDGTLQDRMIGAVAHGDNIRFTERQYDDGDYTSMDFATLWHGLFGCQPQGPQRIRLTYNAGSTITASARAAVLSLAHELYLRVSPCDECGTCRLPARTTSVTREGLSYTLGDPLDSTGLPTAGTGLPDVDMWLRGVNPHGVLRPSAVYSAVAPPPVVHSVITARPLFPPLLLGGIPVRATVTAQGEVS